MIGETIGGYKLTKKLGEGGTGETFLAEHPETGQKAAVKLLYQSMSTDKEQVGRYLTEVRAAGQVNHVGVADLFDSGVHASGRVFLVMEYLSGKTLTDALIESGSVSDPQSLADIGWQLATILQAVHDNKLLHGALKPDGIFLTFPPQQSPRPLIKLLDFGLAKFTLNVRNSQTGSLLGAPLYMSPETARGVSTVDHRADIYSLGCILFELACGRPPFVRQGKGELIIAHMNEPAPFVSSLEPSIPKAIDTLVGRMVTKNPAVRPQTMAEVASVLAKFCPWLASSSGAASTVPPPAPPSFPNPAVVAPPFSTAPPPPPFSTAPPPPPPALVAAPVAASSSTVVYAPPRKSASVSATLQESPSQQRRQEATAYLPPEPKVPPVQAKTEYLPGAQPAWLEKVRQRTAILEPESAAQVRTRPSGAKRVEPSRSSGPQSVPLVERSRHERPSGRVVTGAKPSAGGGGVGGKIDIPVVIVSALAVIAIGVAVLLFVVRKPTATAPSPTGRSTPVSTSHQVAKVGTKPTDNRVAPAPAAKPEPAQTPPPSSSAPEGLVPEKTKRRKEPSVPTQPESQGISAPEGKTPPKHW